ncbi:MAG: hypothetical protein QOF78_1464 [Phycisphaerales bacterium]|jgi:hypothetical protein|nr:hypothetical protein [Phycisphaerales bacterium]
MTQTSIATSADYADALLVARRGKHLLFLILLLMLLGQIAVFFAARYTNVLVPSSTMPTTIPAVAPTRSAVAANYFTGAMTFFGMILPILLAFDLLLILNIMLVGRLLGLARTTSAFLWCLLLMLLLFPVQAFFGGTTEATDFRLPGLLYTWNELVLYAKFPTDNLHLAIMKWTRFVGMPLVAIILLAAIQIKSNRGLRQALGEATPEIS